MKSASGEKSHWGCGGRAGQDATPPDYRPVLTFLRESSAKINILGYPGGVLRATGDAKGAVCIL